MLMRALMLAAVVCGVQGCSRGGGSDIDMMAALAAQRLLPTIAPADVAAGVYAALSSGAGYHGVGAGRMLVKEQLIGIRRVSESAVTEWLEQFDPMPAELRRALRQPPAFGTVAFDRSLFPTATRFISTKLINAAFSHPAAGDDWAQFRREHKADGWVSYSHVVVTSDGMDALVYAEAHCGGLCGAGVYHWLQRPRSEAPWSIMRSIISWIA